jgi:succinate dehydrogenase/fumarate reductase flavoprotein subunit
MNYWDSFANFFKKDKYKYVVVGAGTGGCITAYVLASKMLGNI